MEVEHRLTITITETRNGWVARSKHIPNLLIVEETKEEAMAESLCYAKKARPRGTFRVAYYPMKR